MNIISIIINYILSFFDTCFIIEDMVLKNNKETIIIHKYQLKENKIYILKNGIMLYGLHIPYENLIQYGNVENKIYLKLFSKIERKGPNQILLNIGKERVSISFKTNKSFLAILLISRLNKNAMNYLKKNNILPKVVEYSV